MGSGGELAEFGQMTNTAFMLRSLLWKQNNIHVIVKHDRIFFFF